MRVFAIDWSGDRRDAHQKIWLAEAVDGHLIRLENGRHPAAVGAHLLAEARRDPKLVVGLDFAFSLPAWFLAQRGLTSAAELWALADREADDWLAACEPPFWGRPGRPCPHDPTKAYRRTEAHLRDTHRVRPKSAFQVGGVGAVGTGSLRGMRLLHQLRQSDFSIWPFDPPSWPRVVEIYPRLLTGSVVKSSLMKRVAYLATHYPNLDRDLSSRAARSDDAFDAAVSALVMAQHLDALVTLEPGTDRQTRLEGLIWHPCPSRSA